MSPNTLFVCCFTKPRGLFGLNSFSYTPARLRWTMVLDRTKTVNEMMALLCVCVCLWIYSAILCKSQWSLCPQPQRLQWLCPIREYNYIKQGQHQMADFHPAPREQGDRWTTIHSPQGFTHTLTHPHTLRWWRVMTDWKCREQVVWAGWQLTVLLADIHTSVFLSP